MIGYIYAIHYGDESEIFYIGCTRNPQKRLMGQRGQYPFYIYGRKAQMSIIEESKFTDFSDMRLTESYWIQQFLAWGFKLKNLDLGYGRNVRLIKQYIDIEREYMNKIN